jgi:nitroreductase
MNKALDTMTVRRSIYGRCSVREYSPEIIDQPTLHSLLAAAVRAPTAMHGEPWQFVIQDPAKLKHLMLAAHAMGLDTCVIGSAAAALNTPDMKIELGIPPDVTAIAPIIVGKPRGETAPSARKDPQILAWR